MPRRVPCKNYSTCGRSVRAAESTSGLCRPCYDAQVVAGSQAVRPDDRPPNAAAAPALATPDEVLRAERELRKAKAENTTLRTQYRVALDTIDRQETELHAIGVLRQGQDTYTIEPSVPSGRGTNEGTVVVVASDWHLEEHVAGATVNFCNEFNLEIARTRVETFFRAALRLTNLLNQDIRIETVVLALLGDFITNNIHEELKDLTALTPVHALVLAQTHLVSGIEFLLAHSTYKFVIPCHSGNHARTTKTTHFCAENGHSLEYLLYLYLTAHFRQEPRVTFLVSPGYHSYVNIYDHVIRFHHGHAVKYNGGVGGLTIPTNKAIANWNDTRRATLDVFGHFHQQFDGGNFIANGSLIGYNTFALAIKARFERPQQTLFLLDKKRGKTCVWPILL